jgi:hypothetical protein
VTIGSSNTSNSAIETEIFTIYPSSEACPPLKFIFTIMDISGKTLNLSPVNDLLLYYETQLFKKGLIVKSTSNPLVEGEYNV